MTLSLSTSLLISAPYEFSLLHSPWVRIMCQPQANPRLSLYTYLALSRNQGPFWYQPLEYIQLNFPSLYASRSGVYQVSLDAMLALWYIEPRGSRAEMVSGWKWESERERMVYRVGISSRPSEKSVWNRIADENEQGRKRVLPRRCVPLLRNRLTKLFIEISDLEAACSAGWDLNLSLSPVRPWFKVKKLIWDRKFR